MRSVCGGLCRVWGAALRGEARSAQLRLAARAFARSRRARSVETAGWGGKTETCATIVESEFGDEKTHLRTAKGLARLHTILLILPFHRQRKGDKKVLTGY